MALLHEIRSISKTDRSSAYERIRHIGGINADGILWKITHERAIEGIEKGDWRFFMVKNGSVCNVIVAESIYGYKYIKTEKDGEQPNHLLMLPECP